MSTITDFLIKQSSLQARGVELAGELAKRVMSRDDVINFFNKISPALGRRAAETLTEESYIIPRLGLRTPGLFADINYRNGLGKTDTIDDYLSATLSPKAPAFDALRNYASKNTWLGRRARHALAVQLAHLRKFNNTYKNNFYNKLLRDLQFTPATRDMRSALNAGNVSDDLFTQAALADILRYHNSTSGLVSTQADNLKIPQFVRDWYGRRVQNVNLLPAGSRRAAIGKKIGDWAVDKNPSLGGNPLVETLRGRNAFYTPFGDVVVSSMDDAVTQHEQAHKLLANLYDRNPEQVVDRYRSAFGRLRGAEQRHNLTLPWDNYNTMHEGVTDFTRASLNPLRQDRAYIQKITGRTPSMDVSTLGLNDVPLEEALDQMQINYGSNIAPRGL